jgi:hypothetical protein
MERGTRSRQRRPHGPALAQAYNFSSKESDHAIELGLSALQLYSQLLSLLLQSLQTVFLTIQLPRVPLHQRPFFRTGSWNQLAVSPNVMKPRAGSIRKTGLAKTDHHAGQPL